MLSERQKMEALNYNYQQAQTYNILGRAADQLGGDAECPAPPSELGILPQKGPLTFFDKLPATLP